MVMFAVATIIATSGALGGYVSAGANASILFYLVAAEVAVSTAESHPVRTSYVLHRRLGLRNGRAGRILILSAQERDAIVGAPNACRKSNTADCNETGSDARRVAARLPWCFVAALGSVALMLAVIASTDVAAGKAAAQVPSAAGTWDVTDTNSAGQTQGDTWTITPTNEPGTYNLTNAYSFHDNNASIGSGGSVSLHWTSCAAYSCGGYFNATDTFNLAKCPATFTGTITEFDAKGHPSPGYTWTQKGIRAEPSCHRIASFWLSGHLWTSDCTNTTCTRAGVANSLVSVKGSSVDTSPTSNASGAWSAKVPPGTYDVTPETGFLPASKTVTAGSDVSGIDFAVCGALPSLDAPSPDGVASQLGRRPQIASGQTGCPDAIDWSMVPRTNEVPKEAAASPVGMIGQQDIYAPLTVNLFLTVGGSRVNHCSGGSVWKWWVTGTPAGAKVLETPPAGCRSFMQVTKNGNYTLVAKRFNTRGEVRQMITDTVKVQDLLMLGMGDSNGSGEGLPNPPFWNNQCNRGSNSYQYQAAVQLESQSQDHASVTFVSASCSGAGIENLTYEKYAGVGNGAHGGTPLAPQIDQLEQQLTPPAGQNARSTRWSYPRASTTSLLGQSSSTASNGAARQHARTPT